MGGVKLFYDFLLFSIYFHEALFFGDKVGCRELSLYQGFFKNFDSFFVVVVLVEHLFLSSLVIL